MNIALVHVHPSGPLVALLGNPNCGKTGLFNLLTGSRQKVANYAGVTVERKEGRYVNAAGKTVRVLDLPGAYSLYPRAPDEQIACDVLADRAAGKKKLVALALELRELLDAAHGLDALRGDPFATPGERTGVRAEAGGGLMPLPDLQAVQAQPELRDPAEQDTAAAGDRRDETLLRLYETLAEPEIIDRLERGSA